MWPNPQYFNDTYDLNKLSRLYKEARPFQHVTLDNLIMPQKALKASEAFLNLDLSSWKPYHNPLEEPKFNPLK